MSGNTTLGGTLNVVTGNTTLGGALEVFGNVDVFETLNVSGNVYATSYSSASDYRIKENVQSLDERFTIDDLKPVHYLNTKTGKQDIGLIAHELQEIFPELVNGKKDDEELQAINYIGLIPILIKEIQELKRKLQFIQ